VYFSGDVVVLVLAPESTLVKVVPSVETETSKRYGCEVPSVQAMSTLHTDFSPPESRVMKGLTINYISKLLTSRINDMLNYT
jgi:hypothetical protein